MPSAYTVVRMRRMMWTLLLLGAAGCGGNAISPTDQTLLADASALHGQLSPALLEARGPRLQRYLEQIGLRITQAARELDQQGAISTPGGAGAWMFGGDLAIYLANSEGVNSFTAGGRQIYLYNGLFQKCRSEDEMASILCHEYAHIYLRHMLHDLKKEPGTPQEWAAVYPFATLRIPPAHAREAENVAFTVYVKGGWDPTRYGGVYARLALENASTSDRIVLKEKVAEAQRRTDTLPAAARDWGQPPVADDARFGQLQAEARTSAATASRPERAALLLSSFPSCLVTGETADQVAARVRLFPVANGGGENKWGKGLQGR